MDNLRIWIAATLGWLSIFFNIERFHEPINLASFVYALAAGIVVVTVAIRQKSTCRLDLLLAASLGTFLLLKPLLGYQVVGANLPLTITEACAILVTVLLAHGIARSIGQFEEKAATVMMMHQSEQPTPFDQGRSDLHRELKRAREYERPLSLVTISSDGTVTSAALNALIEDVRRRAMAKYAQTRVGELLVREMRACDLVVTSVDQFVLMLPETTRQHAEDVADRLQGLAKEELGVCLRTGMASFPDEEVTLTGLLERAEQDMASPVEVTTEDQLELEPV